MTPPKYSIIYWDNLSRSWKVFGTTNDLTFADRLLKVAESKEHLALPHLMTQVYSPAPIGSDDEEW